MNTTTVKRNGVYIIFPTRNDAPIKGEAIVPVKDRTEFKVEVKKDIPVRINKPKKKVIENRCCNKPIKVGARKKCIRCGDSVFNNSMYCWDCYKYEHYESR